MYPHRPSGRRRAALTAATAVAILLLPLGVPTGPALARSSPTESTGSVVGLSVGERGPAVAEVQQALIDAGIPVPGGADGHFGQMTATALRTFQDDNGLPATGVVDRETAVALGLVAERATGSGARPLSQVMPAELVGLELGIVGPRVAELQRGLIDAGMRFAGGADGIFGIITQNALRQFQHRHGLVVTGEVDATTAAALFAPPAPVPDTTTRPDLSALAGLAPGAIGEPVRMLQQALLDSGLRFRGGADGVFGPVTAQALKQYQRTRGLEPTGRVDTPTAQALAANAPATVAPEPAPSGDAPTASPVGHPTFGERGERVRVMQQALIDAGVEVPGGADGVFGAQTAGAIMTFQRNEGLAVTGVIDDTAAARLGLNAAPAPPPPSAEGVSLTHVPIQGPCHFGDTWHAPRGGGRLHLGVDLIAPVGAAIYAVADGTITQVYRDRPGSLTGNGLRLTLPDRTYFFYAHLDAIAEGIEVGTQVTAGQIIGTNGSTGNAGIPHLHFEVHPRGNGAVNPYPLVRAIDACR